MVEPKAAGGAGTVEVSISELDQIEFQALRLVEGYHRAREDREAAFALLRRVLDDVDVARAIPLDLARAIAQVLGDLR